MDWCITIVGVAISMGGHLAAETYLEHLAVDSVLLFLLFPLFSWHGWLLDAANTGPLACSSQEYFVTD